MLLYLVHRYKLEIFKDILASFSLHKSILRRKTPELVRNKKTITLEHFQKGPYFCHVMI